MIHPFSGSGNHSLAPVVRCHLFNSLPTIGDGLNLSLRILLLLKVGCGPIFFVAVFYSAPPEVSKTFWFHMLVPNVDADVDVEDNCR